MSIGYTASLKLDCVTFKHLGFVYGKTDSEVQAMAVRLAKDSGYEHGVINLHQMILGNSEFMF